MRKGSPRRNVCVRVFNDRMEQIQMHTRIEQGKFSQVLGAGGFSAPVFARLQTTLSSRKGSICSTV